MRRDKRQATSDEGDTPDRNEAIVKKDKHLRARFKVPQRSGDVDGDEDRLGFWGWRVYWRLASIARSWDGHNGAGAAWRPRSEEPSL